MFSGLVTAVGTVLAAGRDAEGLTLRIAAAYRGLSAGESIAVDGACLTVERKGAGWFEVHVVATSLARTRFADYAVDRPVNLERALRVGDRLGGHLVMGHVDGIGVVQAVRQATDAWLVDIEAPRDVARVAIPLGSITVDGVSLTVNALPAAGIVQVSLIPFTFEHTTLGRKRAGDGVHLEGDLIGKYVDALLKGPPEPPVRGDGGRDGVAP